MLIQDIQTLLAGHKHRTPITVTGRAFRMLRLLRDGRDSAAHDVNIYSEVLKPYKSSPTYPTSNTSNYHKIIQFYPILTLHELHELGKLNPPLGVHRSLRCDSVAHRGFAHGRRLKHCLVIL